MADTDDATPPQPVPPDRRRRAEDQPPDEPATWGGEGVSRDPDHNPELM